MSDPQVVNPYSTGLDVSGVEYDELFPFVDPKFVPFGSKVLVQLRRVISVTKSGIHLPRETKQTEAWNMQVGKVIAIGLLAFKNRKTGEEWPEGAWCKAGDFVRFPRWGGDRLSFDLKDHNEPVVIMVLDDHHLAGRYTGDPRDVSAFLE